MNNTEVKMVQKSFRLPEDVLQYLKQRARERFQTRSELVRQILDEWWEDDLRRRGK